MTINHFNGGGNATHTGAPRTRGNCDPLTPGTIIRMPDGTYHFVQYVNSSGAYAVPLAGIEREIKGNVVNFSAGGRSISTRSLVERLTLAELRSAIGESSPQYHRCAIMAKGGKTKATAAAGKKHGKAGNGHAAAGESLLPDTNPAATLGDFDGGEQTTTEQAAAEGAANAEASTDSAPEGMTDMATKNKAAKGKKAANGKVRAAKPPKTVRKCACGCGGETTSYFAPGHDARLHGWITKLADGRIEPKDIPASTRAKLNLKQTGAGFKATTPNFYRDQA
jgi:hypothetical protein